MKVIKCMGSETTIRKAFDMIIEWYTTKKVKSNFGISNFFTNANANRGLIRMYYHVHKWLADNDIDLLPDNKEKCIKKFIDFYYKR